jgi:hypothetical protein
MRADRAKLHERRDHSYFGAQLPGGNVVQVSYATGDALAMSINSPAASVEQALAKLIRDAHRHTRYRSPERLRAPRRAGKRVTGGSLKRL